MKYIGVLILSITFSISQCLGTATAQTSSSLFSSNYKTANESILKTGTYLDSFLMSPEEQPPQARETVSGTVTDASTGQPLIGVSILVVGTSSGTTTDVNGHYNLNVPSLQDSLRFTYIGYKAKTVAINGQTTVNVTLESSVSNLNQVVVIGFGTSTKRNVLGAVSSVEMGDVNDVQANTFVQKLQGKVSGVNITRATGRLGAPVKINIRGTSSINASSQPLYVIDGMPIVNQVVGGGDQSGISSLINLSSNNIKSIQILKGAAASAIYGTRGSNGVVLITTKSGNGVEGNELNVNVSGGVSMPASKLDMLNSTEYLKIYNYKRGTDYKPSDFPNTDWQDAVSRTGSFQKYNVSFAGANDKNTYFISTNYKNATGMLVGNSLKKFNASVKLNYQFNDRLNIGFHVMPSVAEVGSLNDFTTISTGYGMAVLTPPTVAIFTENGAVNDGRDPSVPGNSIFSPFSGTPYSNVKDDDINNTTRQVLTMINLKYDLLSNLTFKSQFGYQFLNNNVHDRDKNTTSGGYPNGRVSFSQQSFKSANWNNTFTYKKDWNENALEVTVATTLSKTTSDNANASKSNVPGFSLKTLNSAAQTGGIGGSITSYTFQNNVMRISYNYNEKYLVTLTGSYNGTSRFAKGHRYGFFPAIAAGWIISDEDFASGFQALSFLKLHASFGVTGNANIGNFEYPALLSAGVSYHDNPGLEFSQLANLDLTWERNKEYDVALDFGFFNGRLSGKIDYYHKITTDLLLQRRVSDINGFISIFKNGGKMTNSGIEFNFDADVVRTRNLIWNISGNISTLQNEVKKLPGGPIVPTGGVYGSSNIVKEGLPIAAFYLPVYKGVDPENGDALYSDGKGGTTSNYSLAPRQIVGFPEPNFYGGFGTSFSYKGLDFNVQFSYTYGNKLYWSRGTYIIGGASVYNQVKSALDYWTPQNTDATHPQPRLTPNGNTASNRFVYDGSFLRLKSLTLGYTLPSGFIGTKNIRIYIAGTNLLTFTKFPGFDPESALSTTSNIGQGIVRGNGPQAIVINGGIQIKM